MLPRSKPPKSATGVGNGGEQGRRGSEKKAQARETRRQRQPTPRAGQPASTSGTPSRTWRGCSPGAAHRGELGESRRNAGGLDQLAILEPALVHDVLVIDPGERAGMFGSTNVTTTSGRWSTVVDGASHAEEATAVGPWRYPGQ